jgi:hypothetical protein
VEPAEAAPTLWSPSGLVLGFAEPRRVGRVAFELSDAPWIEEPLVQVSLDGSTWERVPARASLADATLSLYRDPRHGRGEVRFEPRLARFVRVDPRLPAREGALEAGE